MTIPETSPKTQEQPSASPRETAQRQDLEFEQSKKEYNSIPWEIKGTYLRRIKANNQILNQALLEELQNHYKKNALLALELNISPQQLGSEFNIPVMARSKAAIEGAINVARRNWKPADGEGQEDGFEDWKLFNPEGTAIRSPKEADLTSEGFKKGLHKETFPRRAKLSDAAIGILVLASIGTQVCAQSWPLNFNVSGMLIKDPKPQHFGDGLQNKDKAWMMFDGYILHGGNEYDQGDPIEIIQRLFSIKALRAANRAIREQV